MGAQKIPRWKMPLWKRELLLFLAAIAVAAALFAAGAAVLFWLPEGDVPPAFFGARFYLRLFLEDPLSLRALWNTLCVPLAVSLAAAVFSRVLAAAVTWRFPTVPAGWMDLAAVVLTVILPVLLLAPALIPVWDNPGLFSWMVPALQKWLLAAAFLILPALLLAFLLWGAERLLRYVVRRLCARRGGIASK
ncbi:MAG TPA: hypothetical protein H9674_09210 [Firmicutes bacterium]|nr:hypothetical protein [Bacillota bacterium]